MIKRFYVPTSKLEEGMQIDQVIKDKDWTVHSLPVALLWMLI